MKEGLYLAYADYFNHIFRKMTKIIFPDTELGRVRVSYDSFILEVDSHLDYLKKWGL